MRERLDTLPHEKQIYEYEKTIERFKEQNKNNPLLSTAELQQLENKLERLKKKVYTSLTPGERLTICRHPSRPRALSYIKNLCSEFTELFGDRTFSDDHAIVGGLGKIDGQKFVVIGQEKGHDTESRVYRNFGMPHPEGFRKALRLMKLAEKFQLPIVCLLDTSGAYPGLAAEERGQAWAIAQNLLEMARIATPIIIVLIGEGSSGGALAMGVGDSIGMLEHGYYSVITPEGCASILWKDARKANEAVCALKVNAEDLLELEVIDQIIKEPLGGAHRDPSIVYEGVKRFILGQWDQFKVIAPDALMERRYQKFRKMGQFKIEPDQIQTGTS